MDSMAKQTSAMPALIVDDDPESLRAMTELLEREGFRVRTAHLLSEARAHMREEQPCVVLVDLALPDGDGLELLKDLPEDGGCQVVLITGNATVETAVEALRRGVTDYLTKPVDVPRLKAVLRNVARTLALRGEIEELRGDLIDLGRLGPLVGASPAMRTVYKLILNVAPTSASVLICGESGVGKELVAQAIHDLSRRRSGPFVAINCGAISPTLIESELFGHERGSFTGADRTHKGVFERADGGTLLLDEITEMPQELQIRLLRVLETRSVTRVGGQQSFPVDVRIVSATNRDPAQAVAGGQLRQDLLYRLKVFPITVPPLRERPEDIELLAQHFLDQLNKSEGSHRTLSREALARLRSYEWPGNVRELKNALHRAYILSDGVISASSLPVSTGAPPPPPGGVATTSSIPPGQPRIELPIGITIKEAERRLLLATLAHHGGDKRRAAQTLGVSLKTLYNWLHAFHERLQQPASPSSPSETNQAM